MHLTHMDNELIFNLLRGINLEFVNELFRDRYERLLGPWQEPINCATTEDSGEFLGSLSELCVDRREGQDHMKVVLNTVQEVGPQDCGRRVLTLLSDLFHVDVLALNGDEILVFLAEQSWDFTSGEHGVDSFKESF